MYLSTYLSTHVLKYSSSLVNGKWRNLAPYRIQTPELFARNIATVDYVRETTRYANCGANPSTGGFWGDG